MRALWIAAGLSVSLATAGCTPPCNQNTRCAIHGAGSDVTVCDGSDYLGCGEDNRGQTLECPKENQQAVCTPDGWTFQPTQ